MKFEIRKTFGNFGGKSWKFRKALAILEKKSGLEKL